MKFVQIRCAGHVTVEGSTLHMATLTCVGSPMHNIAWQTPPLRPGRILTNAQMVDRTTLNPEEKHEPHQLDCKPGCSPKAWLPLGKGYEFIAGAHEFIRFEPPYPSNKLVFLLTATDDPSRGCPKQWVNTVGNENLSVYISPFNQHLRVRSIISPCFAHFSSKPRYSLKRAPINLNL